MRIPIHNSGYLLPAFLVALLAVFATSLPAQSVVADCTQEALEAAIAEALAGDDGWVTFECDGSIRLTNTISLRLDEDFEEPITNGVKQLYIDGTGRSVTIDGFASNSSTNGVRLFTIHPGISLTVTNVKFINGRSTNGGSFYVHSNASLTAIGCVFSNNLAISSNGLNGSSYSGRTSTGSGRNGGTGGSAADAAGGAIYNLGAVWLAHCALLTNGVSAGDGGTGGAGGDGTISGGIGGNGGRGGSALGGAIYNQGTLYISNVAFYINFTVAGYGGPGGAEGNGILAGFVGRGGSAGGASGGAVYNARGGHAINVSSTFAANVALGGGSEAGGSNRGTGKRGGGGGNSSGGAIANFSTNRLINCTFYANTVTGGPGGNGSDGTVRGGAGGGGGSGWGGSIFNGRKADISLLHCTISSGEAIGGTNGAAGGGVIAGRAGSRGLSRGANIANSNGLFRVTNSIIANPVTGTNAYGKNFKGSNNIVTDFSLKAFKTVFTNTDPKLETLQFNGGFVQTMELLEGSPAIDSGHDFPDAPTDARGVGRPIENRADVGAYEYGVFLGPPRIASQPTDATAREGGTVRFTVVAKGDDPLRYQWKKGDDDLDGETSNVLEIFDITENNVGSYSVVVANNSGTITSTEASLSLVRPPIITEDLTDLTVAKGTSFSLSVTAEGDAPLTYQWYRDNVIVRGATLSSIYISEIASNAFYHVVVSNPHGETQSSPANLTVEVTRPAFTTQPTSRIIGVSNAVTFAVVTTGSRPQTYQWYFNDTNIISGATNESYRIPVARSTNTGSYKVIVSNEAGSTNSTNAVLTVVTNRPVIITQPASTTVIAGSTAAFNVAVSSSGPVTYQWYFGTNVVAIAGATNASLSVTNSQATNAGNYRVVIANILGSRTSAVATLTVQSSAPVVTALPADLQVQAGISISLNVGVIGTTPMTFQWFQTPVDSFGVPTSGPVPIANGTNAVLVLPVPSLGQEARWEGTYHVAITNALGGIDTSSNPAFINIEGYGVPP